MGKLKIFNDEFIRFTPSILSLSHKNLTRFYSVDLCRGCEHNNSNIYTDLIACGDGKTSGFSGFCVNFFKRAKISKRKFCK